MKSGDDIARERRRSVHAAMETIGEDLLGRAQREAPVEEGTLRGSGSVEVTETFNGVSVEVSFSTPYAAVQHEETSFHHPKGGKAKYLEDPLKEMIPRYLNALEAAARKAMR